METIDVLKLSEEEQSFYEELFAKVDVDNIDRISTSTVVKLLSSSQLSPETVEKIIQLCGASYFGYFGKHQFFLALRLTSAAQSGLPLTGESLLSDRVLSLPQLELANQPDVQQLFASSEDQDLIDMKKATSHSQNPGQLPPPPAKPNSIRKRDCSKQSENQQKQTGDCLQTHEKLTSDSDSTDGTESNSGEDEEAYTFGEKSWSAFSERRRDGNWSEFEEGHGLLDNVDEESSERGQSENEEDEESFDVWTITEEQQEYYINQFKTMQKDLSGKINGSVAKEFFEKSSLPIHELSKIWQLSDVDSDGALTLEEFCTAMHMVVLRRNNIELPESLPQSLNPYSSTENIVSSLNSSKGNENQTQATHSTSGQSTSELVETDTFSPQSKTWTKFTESPTNALPTISPPSTASSTSGAQPHANIDYNAASIVKDPKILHPVALRLSPDGQAVPYWVNGKETFQNNRPARNTETSSYSGVKSPSTSIPQSASFGLLYTIPGKKEAPPPPPPRPSKSSGHTRSSSLDLNKLALNTEITNNKANAPPLPCRFSPNYKNVISKAHPLINGEESAPASSAFAVYKKYSQTSQNHVDKILMEKIKQKFSLPAEVPLPKSNDVSELLQAIKLLQERNKTLENTVKELIVELCDVIEGKCKLQENFKIEIN